MDRTPLIGSGGVQKGASMKSIVILVLTLALVAATIGVIVLGVRLRDAKRPLPAPEPVSPPPPTPAPAPERDLSYDFPLAPASPWDISENHSLKAEYDVNEGTWMNLDVFGGKIVFDLLGDIYEMPEAGGEATPLISGVAWQTQPRFSPDGQYIIYSSDESGCDNIWVYSVALQRSMQVTYEPFFYVTNAKWKNSTHIVANKWHLVLDRGLAGAEVWEYAVPQNWNEQRPWGDKWGKNEGRQVVGRTNPLAQFGPEEPFARANSVFYSRNMVDTVRWTYNKDPHAGIYSILKVDETAGSYSEPQVITGGPGGAARPIISANGLVLAFIRRTLFETSLMLHNIATGNEVQIFNLGYQDQQESYAPCGVYPSFSFVEASPTGNQNPIAIIAWAGGKIYRIPLPASIDNPTAPVTSAVEIPFTVHVVRDLAPVARVQRSPKIGEVSANTMQTKVAMHASRNFDGSRLSFSTLGDIYVANLTGGQGGVNQTMSAVTKVTFSGVDNPKPAETMYYWPHIDESGEKLVRTAWLDESFGWIEIVDLKSGQVTKITEEPGRFVKPTFNPSRTGILYARAPGDAASGSRYSLRPGIYFTRLNPVTAMPIPGESNIWLCDGEWAEWTDSGDALVVTSSAYPFEVDEISLQRNSWGQLVKPFLRGQYLTSFAISPRNQVIAFVEFEIVYAQPIPHDLQDSDYPLHITARLDNANGNGHTQILSKVGGDVLSFTNGNSLTYGWATTMTTVDLSEMTNRDWSCASQYCYASNQYQTEYSLSQVVPAGTATETVVVFENVTVVPMDSRNGTQEAFFNQKILVQGDVIVAVGDEVEYPVGATIMDMQGAYVLPGFIDAHAHWDSAFTQRWGKTKQGWEFLMNLAYGVTTLHNPSAEFWSVWGDAELIRSGKKIGSRILSTGTVMFGGGGDAHCEVATVEEAKNALKRRAAFGGFSAKSYMIQCRAGRQKVLAAARELSFDVVPEGGMHFAWDLSYIIDGHTTVEHSLPMAPFYDDILQLFGHAQTAWTPTMVVAFGGLWGDRYFYQEDDVFLDPTVQHWIPNDFVRPVSMRRIEADPRDYHVFSIAKAAANVSSTGTPVNIGAHGQMQGIGYLWELKLMKAGGMSNHEVFKTATINPAISLGLDQYIGSIYPGKLADLVFFAPGSNPLDDLDAVKAIQYVMLDGKMYSTADFSTVLPTAAPAPPLTPINTPVV